MVVNWKNGLRRIGIAVTAALVSAGALAIPANAETASLPPFQPYPSDWQPRTDVWPNSNWANRVTPEMRTAMRESCQWFNAQDRILIDGMWGFKDFLGSQRDVWSAPGVETAAGIVKANTDQSATFLEPRVRTLYIINYPDQSEYSPLEHGDSLYHLWYQLTQISDKISKKLPSGQINANMATANFYSDLIRNSGVCNGA
ncbi:hypothetical protein [Mycolicibacterium brumae]|uniref:Uncharacterized protein n=1 Tax=Mycolicibacterium brumae TaxID=85968 RepID=A0A2G5PDF8_9MYCO|nr:hypothetical protein [Mycolicibacterium brumae]MCV7193543.1 hypothetical protein [Mycolicibacterium brumae]PIB76120.1 hypothetical protein CQY22_006990 [Mycolicibacterium brumae]UWW09185.1 hypothetical protein L2Z93_002271 [Mycolicibacterium brumae]